MEKTNDLLYPGDRGELPAETRRVLVNLLRGPTLEGSRHALLWPVLLRDEAIIRSRLHDMFLNLVLDKEQQVAFTQQADVAELDAPVLLRKHTLSLRESALVLHLRAELATADAQSERCVVEREHLLAHLQAYMPSAETDAVRFDKQSDAAIEKLVRLNFLQKLKGSEFRLEVSPALRVLFGAEEIEALTATYTALRAGTLDTLTPEPMDDLENV